MLGRRQVLEPVPAEVARVPSLGQLVADQLAGGLGDHDLTAVSRPGDSCGAMHVDAHVSVAVRQSGSRCGRPCALAPVRRPASRHLPARAARRRPRRPRPWRSGRPRRSCRPRCPSRRPSWVAHARRRIVRCRSSASAYASPSRVNRAVDPSMSENRRVTVPAGSALTSPIRSVYDGPAPSISPFLLRFDRTPQGRGVSTIGSLTSAVRSHQQIRPIGSEAQRSLPGSMGFHSRPSDPPDVWTLR